MFLAVRHLPYDDNRQDLWTAPLTVRGSAQAGPLADRLAQLTRGCGSITLLYSGAERTRQTGAPTAEKFGLTITRANWLANPVRDLGDLTSLDEWPVTDIIVAFCHAPFVDGLFQLADIDSREISIPMGGIFPFQVDLESEADIVYEPLAS
jgi:phosphohistidine phosphatase SixA